MENVLVAAAEKIAQSSAAQLQISKFWQTQECRHHESLYLCGGHARRGHSEPKESLMGSGRYPQVL